MLSAGKWPLYYEKQLANATFRGGIHGCQILAD